MGHDLHVRLAGVVTEQVIPGQQCLIDCHRWDGAAVNQGGQFRQYVGNGRDPIGIVTLGNDHGGAGITHLMAQELTFECRVDRHTDSAEFIDGKPDKDGVGGVIQQRYHGLAFLDPQFAQAIGQATGGLVDIGKAVGVAKKIHELAVAILLGSALQDGVDGV